MVNTHHDAKDVTAADDDEDNSDKVDDNEAAIPPKLKPMAAAATKTAAKKPATTTETTTLPAPNPPLNFSVDSSDRFGITYYCKGTQDFADVVIHVNRCQYESDYHASIAQDGMSISFQCSINLLCYNNEILASIMGNAYSPSNHCAVAYDSVAQEMLAKKIRPNNKPI